MDGVRNRGTLPFDQQLWERRQPMALFNVLSSVVELIEAPTAEAAIADLNTRLRKAGFELYDGQPSNAFESEPQ